MKKLGNKLPVKSQMKALDSSSSDMDPTSIDSSSTDMDGQVRPAKRAMNAIGAMLKNGVKPGKKKAPKISAGPSSANKKDNSKKGRVDNSDDGSND